MSRSGLLDDRIESAEKPSRRWSLAAGVLLSGVALAKAALDLYALSALYRALHIEHPSPGDLLPWAIFPSLAGLCTIVPLLLAVSVPLVWFSGSRSVARQVAAFLYALAVLLVLWYEFAYIRATIWHLTCPGCSGPAL